MDNIKDTTPLVDLHKRFKQDGVVFIPKALSETTLNLALQAYNWSLAHPGPGAAHLPAQANLKDTNRGTFYQDLANPAALSAYAELLKCQEIKQLISSVWDKPDVWFMYEQVFKKSGGLTRRTPWHQDLPYLPVSGEDLAVMWITFDPVSKKDSLEFILGSHHGPVYDGSRFDPEDDTLGLYNSADYPQLPDIEAQRTHWSIVSWPTQPGDVVIFHPAVLHGGGATTDDTQRRTLSLRFFGDTAKVAARPGPKGVERKSNKEAAGQPKIHPLTRMRDCNPGEPFRHADFPRL